MVLANQFGNRDRMKIFRCIDSIQAQIWDFTNQNQIRLRATEGTRSTSSSFPLVFSPKFNMRQTFNALISPMEIPSTEINCKPSNAPMEIGTRSGPLRLKGQRISRRVLCYRDMDSISELALLLSWFFLVFTNFTNVIVISLPLPASLLNHGCKLYSLRTSMIHPAMCSQPRLGITLLST